MIQLAIETSTKRSSLSVHKDRETLVQHCLDSDRPTTATLIPEVARCLHESGIHANQVDLLSLTVGPGSFTGLRVGVTTAKTLAYAIKCAVVGLNSLEVIAAQCIAHAIEQRYDTIVAVMDAQRTEWFSAAFEVTSSGHLQQASPTEIVSPARLLESLGSRCLLTGTGLKKKNLTGSIPVADSNDWTPRSTKVAELAAAKFLSGYQDDPFELVPKYYRLSAAEEKLGHFRN